MTYQIALISDTVLVQPMLSYSVDGTNFTPYVESASLYAVSFRYVKFKLQFTGADRNDLANISNVTVNIQVKRVMDSGVVDILDTPTNGTPVVFNVPFRDINSITLTPLATVEQIAIFDFVDILDPKGFNIYLFNKDGDRATGKVAWKARGVM